VKNILVAIDNLENAAKISPVVRLAVELASAFSSRVKLLHVAPHSRGVPFNVDKEILRHEIAHELHEEHGLLQKLAQQLRDQGVDAIPLLVEGATVKTILHESDRLDVDLIILGCHKHSEMYCALMDGTEEGVLGRCSHPVLFVPLLE